ncbi:hypothetical protein HN695_02625 [Candidatus Woesearchaeota archaeon]|jgi:serine/threonine protein kinase|nr:hypothetical protein [Candidatus Woesearchaeota archaeon]MBT5271991.1 hypothetical protein [Candidatus Woesearchaeota archaeon]MBT6040889.1 hypothetical protein [Candidatus Woesearchaeota archaeon]MBT6336773.1 hypothetical protein [Candidatus Woesearchaeota archaeon]MBT7927206.1 hypothetical protein [Candidatus Woesearchaeota archaeon]
MTGEISCTTTKGVTYKFNPETDKIGKGLGSEVYQAMGSDGNQYAIKVFLKAEPKSNYSGAALDRRSIESFKKSVEDTNALKQEGSEQIMKYNGLGKVEMNNDANEKETRWFAVMDKMDFDCAQLIDIINVSSDYRTQVPESLKDGVPTDINYPSGTDYEDVFGNRNAFAEPEVLSTAYSIILNVLKGVSYLHEQGISKIDGHPYNILIKGEFTKDGLLLEDPESLEVVVSDIWSDRADLTVTMGNVDAEEEFAAHPSRNPQRKGKINSTLYRGEFRKKDVEIPEKEASDIYTVGRIAIELLTGLMPLDQMMRNDTRILDASDLRAKNDHISEEVAEILMEITKGPQKSAGEYLEKLIVAIEDGPYKVKPNSKGFYCVQMPYHELKTFLANTAPGSSPSRNISNLKSKVLEYHENAPSKTHKQRILDYFIGFVGKYKAAVSRKKNGVEGRKAEVETEFGERGSSLATERAGIQEKIAEIEPRYEGLIRDREARDEEIGGLESEKAKRLKKISGEEENFEKEIKKAGQMITELRGIKKED